MRDIIQIVSSDVPTYRDDLFEMSNLGPAETGLPFFVYVSARGSAEHDARIKVTQMPWGAHDIAVYRLRPFGFIDGKDWLTSEQEAILGEWVKLNLTVLIDFWDGRIQVTSELLDRLTSIGNAPPTNYREAVGALRGSAPKVKAIYWYQGAYHLFFDRFSPNETKINSRFLRLGFKQKVILHTDGKNVGMLLWPRTNTL